MKKLLNNDEENTPVISEDNISNESDIRVIRVKSMFQDETLLPDFYFLSANTVGCAKYALPFLEVNLEVEHL